LVPEERLLLVDATEEQKTLERCYGLIEEDLAARNIRRNQTLIAVGGGILQDITAFIATILFRGVRWLFCPTTLLAQADSCVGSKSSLNLGKYKNLLGTFNPPAVIWIDGAFLETLPVEALKSGIGEILHFYLVAGHDGARALMDEYEALLASPRRLLGHVRQSLLIKKRTVEVDEFDQGERNLFNYGHTFGHAIESLTNYAVSHGQAVTLGMDVANFLSVRYGYLSPEAYEAMRCLLDKNLPPVTIRKGQLDEYLAILGKDKKNTDSQLTCILTAGPGAMKKVRVPLDGMLKASLAEYFRIA
jgi:3-dehydroquinate synthase